MMDWDQGGGLGHQHTSTASESDREQDSRRQKVRRTTTASTLENNLELSRSTSASGTLPVPDFTAPPGPPSPGDSKMDERRTPTICANCFASNTPLWRRHPEGHMLCNACGLFFKLHGRSRPLSMKTDVINRRHRGSANNNLSARSSRGPQNPPRRTASKQPPAATATASTTSGVGRRGSDSEHPSYVSSVSPPRRPAELRDKSNIIPLAATAAPHSRAIGAGTLRAAAQGVSMPPRRTERAPAADAGSHARNGRPESMSMSVVPPTRQDPGKHGGVHGRQGAGHKWEWLTMTL